MRARLALPALLAAAATGGLTACGEDEAAPSPAGAAAPPAASTSTAAPASTTTAKAASTKVAGPAVKTIATGLDTPWGITFLPGGDALVAQRGGTIVRVPEEGGRARPVMRVPGAQEDGEGGLLGLAVSPDYADDGLVYASMTTASDNRIVRFRLGGKPRVVVKGLAKASIHNGGRIAFGPDGELYAGVGDAGNTANAQDASSRNGKILRMDPDGSVPADNPTSGSLVYSLGHRNPQGLTWDAQGRLWAAEFGQNTYDEVNLIRPGANYGWPIVEGRGDTQGGKFTNPKVQWSTDVSSPSGIAYANRRLYVAGLGGERLWVVPVSGTRTGTPTARYTGRYGRIRTVVRAPDGAIWMATSNRDGRGTPKAGDDRILRLQR